MPHTTANLLVLIVATMLVTSQVCRWTGAHNVASRLAAAFGPEPFRSHADWCSFGNFPDYMGDWDIAQGKHSRWATWLLVRDTVEAVRNGDELRACFLGSTASHFGVDALSMAHSPLLLMKSEPADLRLLPPALRPLAVRLPVERTTKKLLRYGKGSPETVTDQGFFVAPEPPDLMRPLFDAVGGYVHDYLEDAGTALSYPPDNRRWVVGSEALADDESWSLDTELVELRPGPMPSSVWSVSRLGTEGWGFYHRWLAAHYQGQYLLPVHLFDRASLEQGPPRFCRGAGLRAVLREEFRMGVELTAALYRYIGVAAETSVQANWGPFAGEDARLDALSRDGVAILVCEPLPAWLRTAAFLRQELEMGRKRTESVNGLSLETTADAAAVQDALAGKALVDRHLIVLERLPDRGACGGERLLVAPRCNGRLEIRLQATDRQAMPHLVDLLLDEARAPLWSSAPPHQVIDALRVAWPGARLASSLRCGVHGLKALTDAVMDGSFRTVPKEQEQFVRLAAGAHGGRQSEWDEWFMAEASEAGWLPETAR